MPEYANIVVVQTAFLGDVILTLPVVEKLKSMSPAANIDVVAGPRAVELMAGHPAVRRAISYEKRGRQSGISGLLQMIRILREQRYDAALVPHRSLRSAVLVAASSIPRRVGFDSSAGAFMFTDRVKYESSDHEVDRNLQLLRPLGFPPGRKEYPHLYPSKQDRESIGMLLASNAPDDTQPLIGIAPGTVWNTKRWLRESFVALIGKILADGCAVVLIGGREDGELCADICSAVSSPGVFSAAGRCTLLQSAELIRRCRVLVSNDSAPMHLAVAMQTPVVAIFGATVPEFGFAPYGVHDIVLGTEGLQCRPCSIHGGDRCPIQTFDCMKRISAGDVYAAIRKVLSQLQGVER
ncbi:MAG TPA: lipopolysaccharide heptosyltransferase II [Bacteroidota bacterium]|jgi:heptosyltransferase-2|nr:lipopolysaccharide heptosyltransferase II [Bacteroidota bacterium]